ncbi:response regulator [Alteromonas sp. 1_MG-2023]|uniref:response regulator n=1 Tax=Alteromonas sp. 1_MG-2023 TaxID=3062669 RepID=UPI0026E321BE|nr:response regulator [Alteromonas sp. 1_MG-2023]MDO6566667.1 response regulator [Alteromonas sp. 1_MG-2023]
MMHASEAQIVLYITEPQSDEIVLEIINTHFDDYVACYAMKDLCKLLIDAKPKVLLFTGESLEKSLFTYYRTLEALKSYHLCSHKIVSLIPRQFEKEAYEAHAAGIIDDYMIARPVYELHRIILICEHLFSELGVYVQDKEMLAQQTYFRKIDHFDDKIKHALKHGLEYKNQLKSEFENSIVEIESALERAVTRVEMEQAVDLDIVKLQETLSKIKSDQIRPELIKLQARAISLLEKTLDLKTAGLTPDAGEQKDTAGSSTEATPPAKETDKDYVFNRLYNQDIDPEKVLEKNNEIPSILVVEDDIISLQLTKRLISKYKMHCDTVTTGRQAYASLTTKKYDLVLMDVNLPDSNGIYIVGQASSQQSLNADTPIIMLSGDKHKATVTKAMQKGAKGYIIKPLQKSSFDRLIEKYIPS